MTPPRISVIMPAWNNDRFVAAALASLTAQEGVELEIVVIDDGSTDATADIVADLAENDARIRLLRQPHRGVSAARNAGLAAIRHDLVAFMDSDDLCPPGRLARQAALLAANPGVDLVYGDLLFFYRTGPDGWPIPGGGPPLKTTAINMSTALFRRAILETVGPCDETLEYGEDTDLLLRIQEAGGTSLHEDVNALYYRRHDSNMTNHKVKVRGAWPEVLVRALRRRRGSEATG